MNAPASREEVYDDEALLDAYSRAVIHVVEQLGPAVVSLSVRRQRGRRTRGDGQGSGVLFTPDGYVLTNSHVVHGAAEVEVALHDGRRVQARKVGDDPASDLAVVRVDAAALPHAALETATTPRPGQLAIAIGNPLGFQATVSTGVVSALDRALPARDGRLIDGVIQHTAPLNPGSSGGPLLDSHARVLGINTAMIPMSQGIGFAVPADTARWVVSQLLAHGRVRRAFLGISGQYRPLDRRRARELELAAPGGVEVLGVETGSPAADAGLQEGDLLLAFAGKPLHGIDDLQRLLRAWPAGQSAELELVRAGARVKIAILPRDAR
jgi:S1-C subfamily serine protease